MLRVCLPKSCKGFRWLPYRMTLKSNPACYRWLWFNWAWGPEWEPLKPPPEVDDDCEPPLL